MTGLWRLGWVAFAVVWGAAALGQAVPADVTPGPGGVKTAVRNEPPIAGVARDDSDTIIVDLPPDEDGPVDPLVLHNFDFNGEPVDTAKIHLRELAPGVIELTSLAYQVGYWRFGVVDTGNYYGLGEHFNTLNHAHEIVRNASIDNPGVKGSGAYKCVPFFMSTTGYGLWVDTTGEATFDMNASKRDEVTIDAATAKLRVVLFYNAKARARFPAILEQFTGLAGRAVVPPYWAFAPWLSNDFAIHSGPQNQAEVMDSIDHGRALGLPASVIVIDGPWESGENSFEFNKNQFADAPAMVKHLHEAGYKMVLWQTSWINTKSDPPVDPSFAGKLEMKSPNYDEAAENGFFVKNLDGSPWVGTWWEGEGSLIDFTNVHAKDWWQGQVRKTVAAGADGFKDDDGEGSFVGDVKFADGSDPRLMRNRYGSLYNNAVEEVIQKDLKGNGVLLARSVSTGGMGLGFLWGGDAEGDFSPLNGLPTMVTAGLSAGLSGMPLWASDLGGYFAQDDAPNALLLERWTEFSAFSPVMEVTSTKNLRPWTFDREGSVGTPALDVYRKYAVLHMSMFPYRYAAALEAAKTGMPMMRALVLGYQDDARARATKDEYLFGPDLLVAPVIDENVSRVVYLPEGEWVNLFTGDAVSGPRTVIANAPADTIPVYARRGTILPKIPEDVMTLVPANESGNTAVHTLDKRRVYELIGPAASAPTRAGDFEGRVLVRDGNSLTISGEAPAHVIVKWKFAQARGVTVDGKAVAVKGDAVEFEYAGQGAVVVWQ